MTIKLADAHNAVTLGVDVSKDTLVTHLYPLDIKRTFGNHPDGINQLIEAAKTHKPSHIIFEATGAYHRQLQCALLKAGLPAVRINPLQAKRFAQATGTRVKTDPVDAAMLARFAATLQPKVQPPTDETLDRLHELQVARNGLIKDRTATLNRGKILTLALLQAQNQARLQQINSQLKEIDTEMLALHQQHAELPRRVEIVSSLPAFANVSALALLIGMPELGTLDAKKVGSLVGVAPFSKQSGQWQGKSRIQGGRAEVRHMLYMPALVAIRHNPDMKRTYERLRKAGKPAKVAIIAIIRKLVVLANALLRDNRTWTPDHTTKAS